MKNQVYTPVVLVVDDQPANIQLLGQMLDEGGYEVMPALTGEQAIERAQAKRPDLALLDVFMPAMDGYEVCRRLHALPGYAGLPVIFLTAADDSEYVVRAFKEGAVDYITKPFVPAELLARVRTHVELKRIRDHLNTIILESDELINVVAHDLKNPLSNIRFAAQLMEGNGDQAQREELKDEIMLCADQALQFIQRFLSSRAEGERRRQFSTEPVELQRLAMSVMQSHRATAEARGIGLRLEGEAQAATGDSMAIRNVLQNLVSNAIRHSPDDQEILVLVGTSRPGYVQCLVMDRGPGIPEPERHKLFQRFARFTTAKDSAEYSSGLGLAIAKHDVAQMGGHLWYEPRPGGGSIFGFDLPIFS